jgi:hypothetical protein
VPVVDPARAACAERVIQVVSADQQEGQAEGRAQGLDAHPLRPARRRKTACACTRPSDWIKIKTPVGKAIDAERAKWNE